MASPRSDSSPIISQEGEDDVGSSIVPNSLSAKDAMTSTPDTTPSRRSARKKQSTFSNDFEYYTPSTRKKFEEAEFKPGSDASSTERPPRKEQNEQPADVEEQGTDEEETRKPIKKKVAIKKRKGSVKEDEKDDMQTGGIVNDENPESDMGNTKVDAKLIVKKGRGRPRMQKNLVNKKVDESTEDDGEVTQKKVGRRKRKNVGVVADIKDKKVKGDQLVGGGIQPFDEGDSTPISQLKGEIQKKKPGRKRSVNTLSPLAQNLIKKLAEVSSDSPSDASPGTGYKRKLGAVDRGGGEEVPSKAARSSRIDKLAPALAGLVKRFPPADLGLVRRSPSEIAARVGAVQKAAQTNGTAIVEKTPAKAALETATDFNVKEEVKIEADLPTTKPSTETDKIPEASKVKIEDEKSDLKEGIGSKNMEKIKVVEKIVKKKVKLKKHLKIAEQSQVKKKKSHGLVVKEMVVTAEKKALKSEEKWLMAKAPEIKSEEKLPSSVNKKNVILLDHKPQVPTGNVLGKKLKVKAATDRKSIITQGKVESAGHKNLQELKKVGPEGLKKREAQNQKVDDLLRRGIFHKKKSHQPFGNRSGTKTAGKDNRHDTGKGKEVLTKQEQVMKKAIVQKTEDKTDVKKLKVNERKQSNEVPKIEKSQANSSNKGGRRKSGENAKKLETSVSVDNIVKNGIDEEAPALIPIATLSKSKHKHHKVEHEVPLDMTMMDLFKPDGLVIHDQQKKDLTNQDGKLGQAGGKSQYVMDVYDSSSFVKPENLHHVLIEHQYSKSSPIEKPDGQKNVGVSTAPGRDDDIESVSHKQAVFMDMNLPDQILEESEEPIVEESAGDVLEAWQEDTHHLVSKREVVARPSILESLSSELKENDTKFGIIGQVEAGKGSLVAMDKSVSTEHRSIEPTHDGHCKKKMNDCEKDADAKKTNADAIKPNAAVKKDSTVKKYSTDKKDITHKKDVRDKKDSMDKKDVINKKNNTTKKESTDKKESTIKKDSTNKDCTVARSNSTDKKDITVSRSNNTDKKDISVSKSNSTDKKDISVSRSNSTDKKDITVSRSNSTDKKDITVSRSNNTDKKDIIVSRSNSTDKKDITVSRSNNTDKKDITVSRSNSTDKKDITVSRSNSVEKKKNKKKRELDKTGDEQGNGQKEEEDDADSEGHGFQDDHEDLDWEPNNPDTVYCICRKPHNNRFMICCDKCEEWFHGSCVGITTARGKEMEDQEEEYICPVCSKGDSLSLEKTPAPSKTAEPILVKPKLLQRCVGRKCSRSPRLGSVYCSNECIMSHAQDSLKQIREELMRKKIKESEDGKSSSSSSKTTSSPLVDTVEVVERQTGKVLKGSSAPTQKGLHRWLEQHPTFEVVLPHRRHRGRSSSSNDKHREKETKSDHDHKPSSDKDRRASTDKDKKSDREERSRHSGSSSKDSVKRSDSEKHSVMSQKPDVNSVNLRPEEKKDDGPNQIRINVRTALRDCLSARAQEAEDIMLSSTEIKNLAVTIEEQLFSLFNDTGHKYRTKYRSLVFNIKDQKNKGLFRKILTNKIKPQKLVQMSTEELASRELAKWREQATKHELEMIEKTEQEAMKESEAAKHVRKKTHKGEVEVEDEDLSILEAHIEERKEPEPDTQEEQVQASAIDTTDQHRAHLFDLNCKVCTGKVVPGIEEQAAMAAMTEKIPLPAEVDSQASKIDLQIAEEIVKEAIQAVQKVEQSILSLPKILPTSPKVEETPPPPPPPLSPMLSTSRRESCSSASSTSSSSMKKKVTVRSPDSALQSGLESKPKFNPTGPMLWKGFVSMLDVAKFFTSAYRVSGPTDHVIMPDTVHILGRISPDHMWDYLSKMRQAGSKDVTVIRFIPGSDDEKVAYVHLYSYLNSRGRCGVAGNPNKQIKDFYIVPLASHSKIPRTLLPFDGPGLEENRPHMLIGIMVRQRGKNAGDTSEANSTDSDKSTSQVSAESGKSVSRSSTGGGKSGSRSGTSSAKSSSRISIESDQSGSRVSTGSEKSSSRINSGSEKSSSRVTIGSSLKRVTPTVNRDPRLAKLAAREGSPMVSPAESSSSGTSSAGEVKPKNSEENEAEYIPMPVKLTNTSKPVAEYVPTPTARKKDKDKLEEKKSGKAPHFREFSGQDSWEEKHRHHHSQEHHRHHHHHKKVEKELEDDSEPYSPGKEAEPYSPSQEAAADEPYDPADENLMDDSGDLIISSTEVSSSTIASSNISKPAAPAPAVVTTVGAVCTSTEPAQGEQTSTSSVPPVLPAESKCDTSELVEKMARSNDPHEISSLMVTALSTASSSQAQQKLLVDLTKRVEERKLHLAETARQAAAHVASGSHRLEENENIHSDRPETTTANRPETTTANNNVAMGYPDTKVSSSVSSPNVDVSTTAQDDVAAALPSKLIEVAQEKTVSSSAFMFNLVGSCAQSSDSLPGLASEDANSSKQLVTDLSLLSTYSSSLQTPNTQPPPPKESKDTGGIKFSFTKSKAKTQEILRKSTPELFSSDNAESKPALPMLHDDTFTINSFKSETPGSLVCGQSENTDESNSHVGTSGTIPDTLKALMNDVMGSSQFSTLEREPNISIEMETQKMGLAACTEQKGAAEVQFLNEQAEAQKRLDDEDEARTILDALKKSKTFTGDSQDIATAQFSITSDNTESKPNAEKLTQLQMAAAPSIDELLERLKKGGFQFQKADSNSSSLFPLATTLHNSVTTADSLSTSVSNHSLITTTPPTLKISSELLSAPSPATTIITTDPTIIVEDVDLRQKHDLPHLPAALPPSEAAVTPSLIGTSGSTVIDFGDYDARLPPDLQDRDDRNFYHGQDGGAYPPAAPTPVLKYPDSFPPLPCSYPPHLPVTPSHLSNIPLPSHLPNIPLPSHRPIHEQFPASTSETHVPYSSTSRGSLHVHPHTGRSQPPLLGTETDKSTGVLPVTNVDSPSDIDLRSRIHPPLPTDQIPLPPIPPPSPSPGGQFSHLPPGDMDYRNRDAYSSHHSYPGHGREDSASYYGH